MKHGRRLGAAGVVPWWDGDAGLFVFCFGVEALEGIVDSIDQMLLLSLPKHVSAHTKHELHGTGDDSEDLPAPNFFDKVELG